MEEVVDNPAQLDDARSNIEAVALVIVRGTATSDPVGVLAHQSLEAVLRQHGRAG